MKKTLVIFILVLATYTAFAQNQDTVNVLQNTDMANSAGNNIAEDTVKKEARKRDTFFLMKKEFTPRGATYRSLILPGWGQAYNKQYWKIPIAVAAVGVPIGFYIDNHIWYKRSKTAVEVAFAIEQNSTVEEEQIKRLHPQFLQSYNAVKDRPDGLGLFRNNAILNRNYFRQNQDYSLLWTLVMWGLNVADATVFAHLKQFDVSDNISMKIDPVYFHINKAPGIKLVFTRKK